MQQAAEDEANESSLSISAYSDASNEEDEGEAL